MNAETISPDERESLRNIGLLPNPNFCSPTSWTPPYVDPRVQLHERSLEALAQENRQLIEWEHQQRERVAVAQARANHRRAALEWLLQTYELDELAVEVINHAIVGNSTETAEF